MLKEKTQAQHFMLVFRLDLPACRSQTDQAIQKTIFSFCSTLRAKGKRLFSTERSFDIVWYEFFFIKIRDCCSTHRTHSFVESIQGIVLLGNMTNMDYVQNFISHEMWMKHLAFIEKLFVRVFWMISTDIPWMLWRRLKIYFVAQVLVTMAAYFIHTKVAFMLSVCLFQR